MTRLWPDGIPVWVWGEGETPEGFVWQGTGQRIVQVCNRWRIHTGWWDEAQALWREYVKVATDGGYLCLLYRDRSGGWFLSRLYD